MLARQSSVRLGRSVAYKTLSRAGIQSVRAFADAQQFEPEQRQPSRQRSYSRSKGTQSLSDRLKQSTRPDSRPRTGDATLRARVERPSTPPHLLTLADLSPNQIAGLLRTAVAFKYLGQQSVREKIWKRPSPFIESLAGRTTAMIFSKRSTRTRVASETSAATLGGHAMFLGKEDIQLGVNETLEDSAKVIGSMVDGIMARVGAHSEVEALVNGSGVPVINALSDLYHPTQILADLLTMYEVYSPNHSEWEKNLEFDPLRPQMSVIHAVSEVDIFAPLKGKKVAWVGDTNNVLNDMLVTYPRLGMTLSVASPKGYDKVDERVWARVLEGGHSDKVILTNSPEEALKDADIAVTDTWISMGQEEEKATRLAAFAGYQITEDLCARAGAKPDWKFMHCLPRKQEEVDDDVFYGKRSVVFPEAENRKWTIMACFDHLIGKWKI